MSTRRTLRTGVALLLGAAGTLAATPAGTVNAAPAPARAAVAASYGDVVRADGAHTFWHLDEASGTTAEDSSGGSSDGRYVGDPTRRVAGAVPGSLGVRLDGVDDGVFTKSRFTDPRQLSVEAWVKTTTTRGGTLISFGDRVDGPSTQFDRLIYLTDAGKLVFGLWDGAATTVQSARSVNDGRWHHVVGTVDSDSFALYLDGDLAASRDARPHHHDGYWRIGGDNLSGWPQAPTSTRLAADVDEVAIYGTALTRAQVEEHHEAGTTSTPPSDATVPSAPGTLTASAPSSSRVDLAWGAATDDRGIAGYRITRNGSPLATVGARTSYTDTAVTPGHTYSYSVRAVDTSGNVGPANHSVSVRVPDAPPTTGDVVVHDEDWPGRNGSAWPSDWQTQRRNGTVDVNAGDGRLGVTSGTGSFARAALTGVRAVTDTDLVWSYQWSPTSARSYYNVFVRGTGGWQNPNRPRNGYGLNFVSDTSRVTVQKNVDGRLTNIVGIAGAQPVGAGKRWVRLRVVGNQIMFRTWADGTAEPSTWTWSGTDASLTGAGHVYMTHVRSNRTSAPRMVRVDDLVLTAVGDSTTPPPTGGDGSHTERWSKPRGSSWPSEWTTSSVGGRAVVRAARGRLQVSNRSGAYARAVLDDVDTATDTDLTWSYRWTRTSARSYFNVFVRGSGGWQNANRPLNGYGLNFTSDSTRVTVQKNVNGSLSNLAHLSDGQTGDRGWQRVRLRVEGDRIMVRTWAAGTSEPTSWDWVGTDSSLRGAGHVHLTHVRSGSSTQRRAVVLDDLVLTDLDD
jgi:hypothetical protein